ncbi:A24 family peptidase [Sulfobacillus harzensis]|uniref:Prepilin peptidase n=1 Tax=Sulfobacillus harzensis TaxID=2729629 RepID=A0A7Y0L3F2_9FIRM|nr:A24 family peptidase [Sulfobacillus harzensis]NMP21174.1 prepilin peptidase [Sulfobacillus harzensis]
MVVGVLLALLWAALVYVSVPWWGAAMTAQDRIGASVVTALAGSGMALLVPHIAFWQVGLVAILAVVAAVDWRHHIILNRFVVAALFWGGIARSAYGHWFWAVILGGAVFLFYLMVHVVTHGGLGMGDVKLAGVLAFGLGYPSGLVSVVAGMWAAGIFALVLVVSRRRGSGVMALGPFLAVGGFVGLLDLVH